VGAVVTPAGSLDRRIRRHGYEVDADLWIHGQRGWIQVRKGWIQGRRGWIQGWKGWIQG
jgi:hypothetical protein